MARPPLPLQLSFREARYKDFAVLENATLLTWRLAEVA